MYKNAISLGPYMVNYANFGANRTSLSGVSSHLAAAQNNR